MMPWQPTHMATFFEPFVALPVSVCDWAETVTQATAKANIVVNNLFILRAQSLGDIGSLATFDYMRRLIGRLSAAPCKTRFTGRVATRLCSFIHPPASASSMKF